MNDSITITKPQLQAAMQQWAQDHRDGKCRSDEEVKAMPIEQVAQESADTVWSLLTEPVSA